MTRQPCEHEPAVVQAVLSRQWPDACDPAVREHAEACEVCREVVSVAALLREDYDQARDAITRRDVLLPSAGQIWWRAAVRARADAERSATRPLVWGYGAAAACAIGLTVSGVSLMWPSMLPVFDRVAARVWWVPPAAASAADAMLATLRAQLPLVLVIGACLVAAPLAIYLALREE